MQVNMEGVVVGIVALVMIGVFHPIVIKCEYYFSHRIWPLFLAAGIGFLLAALFTEGMLSMICLLYTSFQLVRNSVLSGLS